jgi:hypothetical protein
MFFGYGPFLVRPSGLPSVQVSGGLFLPKVLTSPDDFTRSPVLLIHPDTALSFAAQGSTALDLLVVRSGEVIVGPMPFQGRAFWVGSDHETAIPAWILRRWEDLQPVPWLPTLSADKAISLNPGEVLKIQLRTPRGLYIPETQHTVRQPNGPNDFVQEIVLRFP